MTYKNFSWTLYPQDDEDNKIKLHCEKSEDLRYLIFGYEKCPSTGNDHLQGYVVFKTKITLPQAKEWFKNLLEHERTHIEISHGNSKSNMEYCRKIRKKDPIPNEKWYEYGTCPKKAVEANKKNAKVYKKIMKLAKKGKIDKIKDEFPTQYFIHKKKIDEFAAERYQNQKHLKECCGWIYTGDSNTGKTYTALVTEGAFDKPIDTKWWDGYDGEDVVLFDEVTPKWMVDNFTFVKRITDIYPFTVEYKGGSRKDIRPKKIIFTTNRPEYEFRLRFDDTDWAAFKKRIQFKIFNNVY